ncbi:MAG: tetratricopeptide repeat protein, partial [Candidatus Hodarchaeota archaeon]
MDLEAIKHEKERAMLLSVQGKFKEADILFQQLYKTAEKSQFHFLTADLLYGRAWNLFFAEQFQLARKLFDELATITKSHYPEGQANALNGRGLVDMEQGKLESGLKNFQQSLNIRKLLGIPPGREYGNIGVIYHRMGKYDKALEHYNLAKNIFEQESTILAQQNAITMLDRIVEIYIDKGEWDIALDLAQQTVDLRKQKTPSRLGDSLLALARCYKAIGQYDNCHNTIKQAIAHNKSLGAEKVKPLLFFVELNLEKGRISEAEKFLEKAMQLAITHESEREKIHCNITKGKLLEKTGNHKQIYELYQQTLQKAKELGLFREILKVNLELAHLDIIEGNFTEAELFIKAVQEPASQHQLTAMKVKALI